MISEEQQKKLDTLIQLFELAEQKIKEIERLDSKLLIPSINELRYFGYHVIKAICYSENSYKFDSEFEKAKNHCQRAIYDVYEVGIIYCLEQIKSFKECFDHCSDLIPDVIGTYAEDLAKADKAVKFINNNKSNSTDRSEYYKIAEPYYRQLDEIRSKFDQAKPLIQKKFNEKRETDQKQTRRFLISITLTIVALLISASILINSL